MQAHSTLCVPGRRYVMARCRSCYRHFPARVRYGRSCGVQPYCSRSCFKDHPRRRFWRQVERGAGCWEWVGVRSKKGYGKFPLSRGDTRLAHRYAWELVRGPIPDNLCVLHHCDNPSCCRPDHLFVGSRADNNADMCAKGRHRAHKRSS